MNVTRAGLTLAGSALVLAVAYINLRTWWRGKRDAKELMPFGQGVTLGALGTMCSGGILGFLSGCSPTIANKAGEQAVDVVTGASPATPVPASSLGQLTPGGAVVVFLVFVGVVLAWKAAPKTDKKRMVGGAFVGSSLCVTAGAATLLDWMPRLVNDAGTELQSFVSGAGIL